MGFLDRYPYTNWHNVNLDWVLERVKEWGELVTANDQAFRDLQEANEAFKQYVTEYLQNLDIQAQIDDKLDRMFESGELTEYLQPYVSDTVTNWLEENITEPVGVVIDSSLTVAGAAADAKSVGDKLGNLTNLETDSKSNLVSAINEIASKSGLDIEAKDALLACFRSVAYVNDNGAYEMLAAVLEGETGYIFITIEDIESFIGYGNISVKNGTVTPETFISFSILTYYPNNIRFTTPENYAPGRFVFNKSGTSYYVVSGSGVIMRFDKTGSRYTAITNIDQSFATITKYNGFSNIEKGRRYQIELDNGIFRLSSASGDKLMEITNANIIGYWGDDSENLGKLWRFENARILNN